MVILINFHIIKGIVLFFIKLIIISKYKLFYLVIYYLLFIYNCFYAINIIKCFIIDKSLWEIL